MISPYDDTLSACVPQPAFRSVTRDLRGVGATIFNAVFVQPPVMRIVILPSHASAEGPPRTRSIGSAIGVSIMIN